MATRPMECDWNTTLVNPEDDHRRVVASPTEWSDESDSWLFDDEQEFNADALENAQNQTFTNSDSGSVDEVHRPLWPFYDPNWPSSFEERLSDWKSRTDSDGNYVSKWFVLHRTRVFMDRSSNPMTYMDGPHNVRLMMPQPIPPPESSHTLRKGLWDCHEVNGQIVTTEQMAPEAETFESSDADLGQVSRAPRATEFNIERVRQAPVGPRPMKRQRTVTSPKVMQADTGTTQDSYCMAAVARLKEASVSTHDTAADPMLF